MHMQQVDGSFYTTYSPSLGGRWDEWRSLYYPGEAALGLVMLHDADPSSEWGAIALRALLYLARERFEAGKAPDDHWALIATASLFKSAPELVSAEEREMLMHHALQVCDAFLKKKASSERNPRYLGGFGAEGQTATTATAVEGLVAILPYVPESDGRYKPIKEAVDSSITFLLSAQVKSGLYEGAVPAATAHLPKGALSSMDDGMGRSEVRIDYVQHALSAWIDYVALVAARERSDAN